MHAQYQAMLFAEKSRSSASLDSTSSRSRNAGSSWHNARTAASCRPGTLDELVIGAHALDPNKAQNSRPIHRDVPAGARP